MFERFTPRARRVVVLAQDTAREMSHPQIKPEHILLALRDGEGMAAMAMEQAGVDGDAMRQVVARRIKAKPSARDVDKVPFSTGGKKALELSLRAALKLGHNYIGTEHLFLGVQQEAEKRGRTLTDLLGVEAADVHRRLMEMVEGATGSHRLRSPALDAAMNAARRQAGLVPLTTGHLLAAIIGDADCQAGRALRASGLSPEAVTAALMSVPVAGTTDESPSPQGVSITVGPSTTHVGDADVAAALQRMDSGQIRDLIRKALGLSGSEAAAG